MAASSASDFEVLDKVGEGAFGTVFRARERASGALVALKKLRVRDVRVLPINAIRELNALRRCSHPLFQSFLHALPSRLMLA